MQIGGGTGSYFSQTSGNDIIVAVGEGSINLRGAATLSTVNIAGEYNNPSLITGTEGNDNIDNRLAGATIQTFAGDDSIWNLANSVTIDSGDGNDDIANIEGKNVSINGGDGNDTIYNTYNNVVVERSCNTVSNFFDSKRIEIPPYSRFA